MDAILISPMEVSLRQSPRTFRENNVKDDVDSLTSGPMNQVFVRRYRENLGVSCLAAYLREKGMDVMLFNANIQRMSTQEIVDEVIKQNPLLVGVSCLYDLHAYQAALIIRDLRRAGYQGHITLGGPFGAFTYQYFLAMFPDALDSVVRGEGEKPLYELVSALKNGESWRDIRGVSYLKEPRNIKMNPAGEVESLDNLPNPSRDALDALRKAGIAPRVASLYSSRGCFGRCTYCHAPATAEMVDAKKWRYRPAINVLNEIEYLVNEYGVEYLYFNDDNFMGYGAEAKRRLTELAQGIVDRGIKVHFHGECRVDTKSFLDTEFLELMKKAGFKDVLLGLESGSQTTLNRWRKGTTVNGNLAATKLLTDMGFDVEPAMILVDAYTTLEEFSDTVQFIEEAELHKKGFPMYLFNRLVVFPGAPIEFELMANGVIEYLDPFEIAHDLEDDNGLYEHIRRVSSRPYKIKSQQIAVMWDALIQHTDRLSYLVDEVIPGVLREWRTSLVSPEMSREEKAANKDSYLLFVQQLRRWRKGMGDLSLDLLKTCVKLAGELDPADPNTPSVYHDVFERMIEEFERKCFDSSLEARLSREHQYVGEIAFEEFAVVK
ncbi:radical SAM protein [Tumebacillus sp. DT12]|uniref:Radical SAM protein n=1 Tax=Tumebacillus lacus TaxID=2995335 RepID=A0ABT3WZZ5_9BACL|nr:radical SAM protein [Tumebacillus lacus]MCX7570228.1 radical SAM protein [Tumebacillus lacus]